MPRKNTRQTLIPLLIAEFPRFVHAYERDPPFKRYGQLEFHVKTILRRRALSSVGEALNDELLLVALYDTLGAWGLGTRASHLLTRDRFCLALQAKQSDIATFEKLAIDDANLEVEDVASALGELINDLGIVGNDAKIVAGTKTLHHLLPELVVPIDRAYTQKFFGWNNANFQYGQEKCFREAFRSFAEVARATNPSQYVGPGWHSSKSKVIDNAIVLCSAVRESK